ncbi:MAG: hypothetical protein ACREQP_18520 [Candidatus Binatia bacterium]
MPAPLELLSYELGFQSERRTDGQEGEKIPPVVAKKPFFRLTRRLALDRPHPNLKLFLKAKESVFEHCIE